MTKYLVFVWLIVQILYLSHFTESVSCKFKDLIPSSAYVKASVEQLRPVDGCLSQELTENQQEVYVVGLANWTAGTRDQILVIDLYLHHIASNVSSSDRIFVLASTQPVSWQLHSGGHRHDHLGKFLVSHYSHISHDPHLKFKMRRMAIPFSDDMSLLESWARKKWGAVTTLVYLRQSVTWIRLPVGQAPDSSQLCDIQVDLPNMAAGLIEEQLVQGTFRKINETVYHRDIHIIELMSVASFDHQGHGLATVELNIQSIVSPPRKTELLLILKSHQPVKWKVATRRLRGTIDFITDQLLDSNGINMRYFQVSAERLSSYSCRGLLTWATEKYGPSVSYTFVKLANKLDLTVDTKDWTDVEMPSTTPSPVHEKHSTLSVAKNLKHSIIRSLSLSCKENGMKIAIWKYSLRHYPVSIANISLLSPFCQATDVGAQFVLAARYSDCGTRKQITRDGASVFTNAVVLRPMSQDSRLKALAEPSSPIVINVSCHYLVPKSGQHDQPSNVHFEMKLFKDRAFHNEIAIFPAKFSMADQLFVEVSITNGAQLNVLVNNCSLEPDQSGSHLREQQLIVDGCPADETIQWIDEKDISTGRVGRHFVFDFLEHWDTDTVVTLKCSVTICTQHADHGIPGIAQCSSDQPNCDHRKSSAPIRDSITLVTRGPLVLLSVNKAPPSSVIETPAAKPKVIVLPKQIPIHSDTAHSTCSGVLVVEGVTTGAVIGISFAAFSIGVLLMSSLWYIHTRTGPKKRIGLKSSDSRGASIPGSGLSSIQRDASTR